MKRSAEIAILLFFFAGSVTFAQTKYTIQTLQYPQAFATYATGINSSGLVVGTYYDSSGVQHGFAFSQSTYSAINLTGATSTWTSGVNDSDEYAGYYHTVAGTEGYTLLNGRYTPVKGSGDELQLLGIDNAGNVVGYTTPSITDTTASGLAIIGGTTRAINIAGQASTWVTGINAKSAMVGYAGTPGVSLEAFVFAGTTPTIVHYPGATQTVFNGINDLHEIVGYEAGASGIPAGFIYSAGTFTAFSISGAQAAVPQAINNSGVIVGYYTENDVTYGFIATPEK